MGSSPSTSSTTLTTGAKNSVMIAISAQVAVM